LSTTDRNAIEGAHGLRAAISNNLKLFTRLPASAHGVPAAVAIVVLEGGDGACLPLLVRAAGLSSHPGQVALPGGKVDKGEQPVEAALRELHEELGLAVDDSAVLGLLDDFDTRSGFTITPVVIWGGAATTVLEPSRDEVAQLFLLNLRELRSAVAGASRGESHAFCLELPWSRVYAPTAAILYQFSEVALDGHLSRVNDFYQPPFTHR
jgi:8-oxo-dGTP pyrophosphatase MutT (NUDIX family)